MYHPLLDDLTKLKDQDLDNKLSDLSRKYFIAAKMGQGAAAQQISVILEMYKSEQVRRQIQSTMAMGKKKNSDLDDLINIE